MISDEKKYAAPQWAAHYGCDAIVVADGDFPSHAFPLSLLQASLHPANMARPLLCCCDGAGQKLVERGIMPDAIVGDGDSLSPDFKAKHSDIIHIVEEQEYNDLTKATRFVLNALRPDTRQPHDSHCDTPSPPTICYLACTGKREDHTMGNIFLMPYYLRTFGIQPLLLTDHGIFVPSHGDRTFSSFPQQQVSIFNLSCTRLSSEGLKWQAYPSKEMWQGTLNESLGTSFTIHADGEYMVFLTYEKKSL